MGQTYSTLPELLHDVTSALEARLALEAAMLTPVCRDVAQALVPGSAGVVDRALRPAAAAAAPAASEEDKKRARKRAREAKAKREALREGKLPALEVITAAVTAARITTTYVSLPCAGGKMVIIDVAPCGACRTGAFVVEFNDVAAKRYGTTATTIYMRPRGQWLRRRARRVIAHLAAQPGKFARRALWQGTTFSQLVDILAGTAPKLAAEIESLCECDTAGTAAAGADTVVSDWCGYVCKVPHVKTYAALLMARLGAKSMPALAAETRVKFLQGQARRAA